MVYTSFQHQILDLPNLLCFNQNGPNKLSAAQELSHRIGHRTQMQLPMQRTAYRPVHRGELRGGI